MKLAPNMPTTWPWGSPGRLPDPPIQVIGAVDGDGVRVVLPSPPRLYDMVRLLEIDAPELARRGGMGARIALHRILQQGPLSLQCPLVEPLQRGRCNRILAWPWVGALNVCIAMVATGWARPFHKFGFGPYAPAIDEAYARAVAGKLGIWSDELDPRPALMEPLK